MPDNYITLSQLTKTTKGLVNKINAESTVTNNKIGNLANLNTTTKTDLVAAINEAAASGGTSITVDSDLSDTSENAVQNKVIQAALNQKADRSEIVQVDTAIKPNSENPVQNKVIYQLYQQMGLNYNTLHDELDRMFIAEFKNYDYTKFSDVKSAYSDGKYLLCLDSYTEVMFPLVAHQEADTENDIVESFTFGGVAGDEFVRLTCSNVTDNGDWPPPEVWTRTFSILPEPATTSPQMDGTAAIGLSEKYALADHRHPSDTSRLAVNQGTGNAGKFLTVNSDGAVTPTTVTIPNVSEWALAANKPTYTANEVGALPDTYTAPVTSVNGMTGVVTLSIPAAQVQSDWNATTGMGAILNKPTIPAATTITNTLASGTLIATINGTNIYAPAYTDADGVSY